MNIYVGNLSRTTSEASLRGLFEQFGQVESVKIMKDRITGEHRGFAFVTMSDDAEAQRAIAELNSKEFEGRRLTVNEARPREERPMGGRQGGGRPMGGNRDRAPRSNRF